MIAREIKEYLSDRRITMTEVGARLGCSQQAVSNQLSGRKIGANVARKWAEEFGFDPMYLMTGVGSLIRDESYGMRKHFDFISSPDWKEAVIRKRVKREEQTDDQNTVPLLPIFAQAGHLTGWSESVTEVECERVISPVKNIDMAVHIYGESMYPDIPNGSVAYVRKVSGRIIDWGKAYILDTVDGPLVKYITPGEDEEHIKCVSANHDPKYAPIEVAKQDVIGLYRVVMCMKMM